MPKSKVRKKSDFTASSVSRTPVKVKAGPSSVGTAACAILGLVVAAGVVIVVTDPPGRILGGIAAVGLLAFASMSWRARPKLAIAADGLVVRGWLRTLTLGRDDIARIRI